MPAGEQGGVLEPADRAGGGEEERRDCREGGGGPGSGSTFPGLGQVLGEAGLRGAQAGAGEHRGSQGEPHEDVALPTAGTPGLNSPVSLENIFAFQAPNNLELSTLERLPVK